MIKPFDYPTKMHRRRHGPRGYQRWQSYKPWLRDEFSFRCVYCLHREPWYPNGHGSFGVEHLTPKSLDFDLRFDYDNLAYACNRCNCLRGARPMIDPCTNPLGNHVVVYEDGRIEPLTRDGRRLVRMLCMDSNQSTEFRQKTLLLLKALRSKQTAELKKMTDWWLGPPSDMPNLRKLRPPKGNKRASGVRRSWYARRPR